MTDKKLTDNEIVKALECCLDISPSTCKNCPLFNVTNSTMVCSKIATKSALDLITRQQAENENLKVENQSLRSAANSLKMHYEEAQAEIERLKKEDEDKERAYNDEFCLRKEWKSKCQELLQEKQTTKAEAYKEFSERLQEHINNCHSISDEGEYVCYDCACANVTNCIDNLVKEMVGENNA